MYCHLKKVVIDDDWMKEVVSFVDSFCWVISKCCKKMLRGFLVKGERFASHHRGTYAGWEAISPFAKKPPTFFSTLWEDPTKAINKETSSFIHTTSKPLFWDEQVIIIVKQNQQRSVVVTLFSKHFSPHHFLFPPKNGGSCFVSKATLIWEKKCPFHKKIYLFKL